MATCLMCGNEVDKAASYCGRCGQAVRRPSPLPERKPKYPEAPHEASTRRWNAWLLASLGIAVIAAVALGVALVERPPAATRATAPDSTAQVDPTPDVPSSEQQISSHAFVLKVRHTLSESHDTVSRLRTTIAAIEQGSLQARVGRQAIGDVLTDRQESLATIRTWKVEPQALTAQELLIDALQLSIRDDQGYFHWATLLAHGDTARARQVFQRTAADTPVNTAKAAFLQAYNRLRRSLGIRPIPSSYSF